MSGADFPATFLADLDAAVMARHGKPERGEVRFRCPSGQHEDRHPSARWNRTKATWCCDVCNAGSGALDLAERLGVEKPQRQPEPTLDRRRIVTTYDYPNASGDLLFQVVRYEPKGFRQRRPDGRGGWLWNLSGIEPVLYRLPELLAEPDRWVSLPAGEKDADRLHALGLLATTAPMGEGKPWRESYSETLRGRAVVILADNDAVGLKHAHTIAQALSGVAKRVKVVTFPELTPKGDVSDWLDLGHTKDDLLRRMNDAPDWTPEMVSPEVATNRTAPVLLVRRMSDVPAQPIDWLWPNWLALGKVAILGGHAGDGKSTLLTWLAAVLSRGGSLPDGQRAPVVNSALLLAEDDLSDTVRPRLDLHHADHERILVFEAVKEESGRERFISLADHVELMRAVIRAEGIGLLGIDPLTAFLPKTHRNAEGDVRDNLMALLKLAQEERIAVLGIMHIGKSGAGQRRALQQLLGSTAFGALARVVWMNAELPDDDQPKQEDGRDKRRVLGVVKSNISIKPPALEWSRPLDGRIEWHGQSKHRVEDILAGAADKPVDVATTFLEEALKGGGKPSDELKRAAAAEGIAWATVRRAKDTLGITAEPEKSQAGTVRRWIWRLPPSKPHAHFALNTKSEHLEHLDSAKPHAHTAKSEHVEKQARIGPDAHISQTEHLDSGDEARKPDAHFREYGKVSIWTPGDDPELEEMVARLLAFSPAELSGYRAELDAAPVDDPDLPREHEALRQAEAWLRTTGQEAAD